MNNLILVRHGLSIFNKKNLATGWLDVDLAQEGKKEAEEAGLLIKKLNITFDFAFSSIQKRTKHSVLCASNLSFFIVVLIMNFSAL